MSNLRNDPEGEINQRLTKQSEREIFALKMMHNAAIEESNVIDHCDLMMEEFDRIKAIVLNYSELPYSSEILQLCDRAIQNTKQKVPVIAQLASEKEARVKAEKFTSELAESLAKRWYNAKPPENCDLSHYCLDVIAGVFLAKETAEARVKELEAEVETVKFKWDSEVCQICNYMRSPVAPCKCGQLAMTGTNDRLREQLKKAEEQIKRLNTLRS